MLHFNESTHTYRHHDHTFKYSVTEVVNKYVPPFPAGAVAQAVAKKEGVEPDYILQKWELNKQIACEYGDAVDKAVQYWIDFKEEPKQKHLKDIISRFKKDHAGDLLSQVVVYDLESSVCGTVDVIERLGNKKINITDVKSNADLYKKGSGKLLAPFNDLENNNINKYRLQLSLYKDLFEKRGVSVENISIWHPEKGIINVQPLNTKEIWKTLTTQSS